MRREVKMLWVALWFYTLFNCGLMVFNANQYQADKKELMGVNKELLQSLNKKNAELETARNNLNEAYEVMGEVFLASMELTKAHNKLKNKCKGTK